MANLDQIYLMTPDLGESKDFFGETLGLTQTREGERSVEFDTGECELKIERDFDAETLDAFGMEQPDTDRGDGVVIVIEVDDVEGVHGKALEDDADVLIEPRTVDWGRKMFLVRSPAGYVVEVSRPV